MVAKGNVYGTPIVNIHIHMKFKTIQRRYIACIMVVQIKDIFLFTILFLRSTNSYLSFCFIASFALVLQRHRAKPIPLKDTACNHRLSLRESSRDSG